MPRTALIASAAWALTLLLTTSAAFGQSPPKSEAAEPTEITTPLDEGRRRQTPEQIMADCMALWEPATHMTKDQWLQVCKRMNASK